MIPVEVSNWPEKLSGKIVREKKRQFTESELGYIEAALFAVADQIKKT